MKGSIPHIVKYDDSLVIKGSVEQIQKGGPIEAVTLDGETVTVIPGDFIQKSDDGTVIHHITPPIQKPEIRKHPSEKDTFMIVGSATQIQEGEPVEVETFGGEIVTVIPGDFIQKSDDGTVAHRVILPVRKPEIREHPSQKGIFIIVGLAAQIQEGESIEAVTPNGSTITVVPGARLKRFENDEVVHIVGHLDHRENFMDELRIVSKNYARTHNAHVFYYNGEINQLGLKKLIDVVETEKAQSVNCSDEQKIVLLILFTPGGDPHIAYKCANFLKKRYSKFQILVPGICKSAGTLMAIGAHEIYVSDFGELGPIDMQVLDRDEGRLGSSATIRASLNAIRENSYDMFHFYMDRFNKDYGMIKLATRLIVENNMVGRIDKAIAEKIDPIELGQMHRFLQTCYQYGIRLAKNGSNVDADGVTKLVYDYPEHGFVIDNTEMQTIFKRQIPLSPDLDDIIGTMDPYVDELNSESYYARRPRIELISESSSNS